MCWACFWDNQMLKSVKTRHQLWEWWPQVWLPASKPSQLNSIKTNRTYQYYQCNPSNIPMLLYPLFLFFVFSLLSYILYLEKEWEHSFSLFNYLEKNEEASVNALVSFFCSNEFSFLSFLCIYLCKTENHSVWELIGKIYSSFSCGLFYHGHTILTTLNDWISNQYCDAHIAQLAIISTKYANFQSCSFCSTLLLRHWFSVCDSVLCGFSYI